MNDMTRRIAILWRAERLVTEIRLALLLRRAVWIALACFVAMFGLVMLNLAAFFALEELLGPPWGALALAAADFALAAMALVVAALFRPGRELEVAVELRNAALASLPTRPQDVVASVVGPQGLFREPLGAALTFVVSSLVAGLRRRSAKSGS